MTHENIRNQKRFRNKIRIGLFFMAALFLGGCSLALEEIPSGRDRLAGVFVTAAPIEPGEAQLEYDLQGNIRIKESEPTKIYGKFTPQSAADVTFPGVEGYGVYSLEMPEGDGQEAAGYNICDDIFTDLHFTVSDEEETIEASFYASSTDRWVYCFNPVYQQADGQIYVLAGSGVSSASFAEGTRFSHSLSESESQRVGDDETVTGRSFTITVIGAAPPRDMELLVADRTHRVCQRYGKEQLDALVQADQPLALPEDAAYLILQQAPSEEGQMRYRLFDRDADSVEYMAQAEDGYLHIRRVLLEWP